MAQLTIKYQPSKQETVDVEVDSIEDINNITEIRLGDKVIFQKQQLNLGLILSLLKESGVDTGDMSTILEHLKTFPVGNLLGLVTKIMKML